MSAQEDCETQREGPCTFLLAMRLRACFWMVTAAAARFALSAARAAWRLPSSVALRKLLRVRCPRTAACILTAALFLCTMPRCLAHRSYTLSTAKQANLQEVQAITAGGNALPQLWQCLQMSPTHVAACEHISDA